MAERSRPVITVVGLLIAMSCSLALAFGGTLLLTWVVFFATVVAMVDTHRRAVEPSQSAETPSAKVSSKEIEAELEARLRAVMACATEIAILIVSPEGIVRRASAGAEVLLGRSNAELSGTIGLVELHHPDDAPTIERYLIECSSGTAERRMVCKAGDEIPVLESLTAVHDAAGDLVGHLVMAVDLSDRKRAEAEVLEARATLEAVVETAVDAIITIDAHGIVQWANHATEMLFGYPLDEVVGQKVDKLMPEPYRTEHDSYLERYLSTGEAHIVGIGREAVGVRKSGEEFPLYLAVSDLKIGDKRLFTGIARDITEVKHAEKVLVQARMEAEEAYRAKSSFFATMSHELRTPLNHVIGYAELLEEDSAADGKTEAVADLQKIQSSARALLGLLDSILEMARLEAGRMKVQLGDFNPYDAIDGAVFKTKAATEASRSEVKVEVEGELGMIYTDGDKLGWIIDELVDNAARHAEAGTITIRAARLGAGAAERVEIEVTDDGAGIVADRLSTLFRPFAHGSDPLTRRAGGAGLGLAICKGYAEMLGGELSVVSRFGEGSTFTLRLPLRAPAQ